MSDNSKKIQSDQTRILNYPQSRTKPKGSNGRFKDLGLSKLSQKHNIDHPGLKGHWCSRCKGIWYGFAGECECPQCGNRNG